MSKESFKLGLVTKQQAADILLKFHYLKDISKGFKSGFNVGLFDNEELVGVCIFTGFPVPELVTGMFGLPRENQDGFFELSRLCLTPEIQKQEHNLASWFVSRSIRFLRKEKSVRAILSYADSTFHSGTVYKACNFKYYGLTEAKKDFFIKQPDGSFIKHSRGKVKGIEGEWRDRSVKHRYVLVYDKNLDIKWKDTNES
jgi:hypothetical protein